MAYFRKRSGAWEATIDRKGFKRLSRTFDTKAEAEAWSKVTEAEMVRGVFVSRQEAENTTLSEALDRYEREVTVNQKGSNRYASLIRILKRHPLANRSLASLQGKDLAEYRDKRSKEVSAQSVLHELSIISRLFNTAIKEWGMAGLLNPVMQIRKPERPPGRDRRLLPGELERILFSSESLVLSDVVRFAVETGMRRAEIAGMTWEMVDLKKRTVTLQVTKNGDKRIVPLSSEAVRILSNLLRRIDGAIWGMEPDSITQAFNRAVTRARALYEKESQGTNSAQDPSFLTDLTFHDLRHEATSRFFEKGLNPMQVAAITGHKTLQMLKRYTHLKAEDLAEMLR